MAETSGSQAVLTARVEPRGRRALGWVRRHERLSLLGMMAPGVVYLLVFFAYPLGFNVTMSLEHYTVASFFTGDAPFVGLANYLAVAADPRASTAVINTVLFTVGSIVPQFCLGMLLALFFQRHFPLRGTLRALLLLPWLIPLLVSGAVFRWMYDQDYGVLNQFLLNAHLVRHPFPWLTDRWFALAAVTLTNVWIGIPFNLVILYSGLEGLPQELYEAAQVDGAGVLARFRHLTIPLLKPVIAIVLTLGLIYTIRVFDVIMVLTGGGPANATQTLTTWSYALSFQDLSFGQGAAVGNILLVVALVFAVVYLRSTRESLRQEASS
jgi:multiple sugar transport system permease protein